MEVGGGRSHGCSSSIRRAPLSPPFRSTRSPNPKYLHARAQALPSSLLWGLSQDTQDKEFFCKCGEQRTQGCPRERGLLIQLHMTHKAADFHQEGSLPSVAMPVLPLKGVLVPARLWSASFLPLWLALGCRQLGGVLAVGLQDLKGSCPCSASGTLALGPSWQN